MELRVWRTSAGVLTYLFSSTAEDDRPDNVVANAKANGIRLIVTLWV